MFTSAFLRMKVTPPTLTIRAEVIGPDDAPASRIRSRDHSSSWSCRILYVDSKGKEKERDITCRRLDGYGHATHIHAYCHAREAPRMFKIENIREVMDLATGEMVEAKRHFEMLAATGALPFEDKGFADFTKITLFMAKCDGDYHPLEADALEAAITAYVIRFGGNDDMIEAAMRRTPAIAPDGRDVAIGLKRLKSSPIGTRVSRLILDHCGLIMDADGRHDQRETAWALELQEALKAQL